MSPRPARIQVAGGIYHSYSRATGGELMFRDDRDRDRFVSILAETVEKYEWTLHFFCVLGTHFHLLLTTQQANIAASMQFLNGVYCQSFNRRHNRRGHLVGDRYGTVLVESEQHGAALVPYLALNPVRAGFVTRPEDWPWSSYASLIGLQPGWDFVKPDWVLTQFDEDLDRARVAIRELVDQMLADDALAA